jgi:hypothetical protein
MVFVRLLRAPLSGLPGHEIFFLVFVKKVNPTFCAALPYLASASCGLWPQTKPAKNGGSYFSPP